MYEIKIDENDKIFSVKMSGFMTESESRSYIEEFKRTVKGIIPSNYAMLVDIRDLHTTSQSLLGLMKEAQDLAAGTPFRARYSIMPENVIANLQVKRIGDDGDVFDGNILVGSYEQAVELSKQRIMHY